MLDYRKLTYAEGIPFAEQSPLVVEHSPSDVLMQRLYKVADYCSGFYAEERGDADLVGLFIFNQSEQAGADRDTFGLCHIGKPTGSNEEKGIIGLSAELLRSEPFELQCYVFLHELAHLTDIDHNDKFTERLNGFMRAYCSRNERMDGRARRLKAKRAMLF